MTQLTRTIIIIVFALVGVTVSIYALFHNAGFVSGAFCTLNETFDCDVVNKGPYSQIAGIPVALIGVVGYVFIAISAFVHLKKPHDRAIAQFVLLASIGGLLFSFYLTGIEFAILKTWCLICITSQISILVIFSFSLWNYLSMERSVK